MDIHLVQNKIYTIRGQKVMLDFDLAAIYGVETRVQKQSVRRNIERFEGEDFMLELTSEETKEISRSQCVTMNKGSGYNFKYSPFAFTELGVAMLSSVLHSTTAIEINRNIMRAFVAVRQMLTHAPTDRFSELQKEINGLKAYMDEVLTDQNDINEDTRMQLELINLSLAELQAGKRLSDYPRRRIGFIREEE
jgi:hypothetical protein